MSETKKHELPWLKLACIPLALIACGTVIYLLFGEVLAGVVEALEPYGLWGLALLPFVYVLACVLLLPASVVTVGAGFLAALLWPEQPLLAVAVGTAVISVGMFLGSSSAFLIGRTIGRDYVARKIQGKKRFEAVEKAVKDNAFKIIFLVRLSPAFPFNVMNYVLSLTPVRWPQFALASWLGMLPGTILVVYAGTGIPSLAAFVEGGLDEMPGRTCMLALGLAATAVVVVLVTRLARRALDEAMASVQQDQRS